MQAGIDLGAFEAGIAQRAATLCLPQFQCQLQIRHLPGDVYAATGLQFDRLGRDAIDNNLHRLKCCYLRLLVDADTAVQGDVNHLLMLNRGDRISRFDCTYVICVL